MGIYDTLSWMNSKAYNARMAVTNTTMDAVRTVHSTAVKVNKVAYEARIAIQDGAVEAVQDTKTAFNETMTGTAIIVDQTVDDISTTITTTMQEGELALANAVTSMPGIDTLADRGEKIQEGARAAQKKLDEGLKAADKEWQKGNYTGSLKTGVSSLAGGAKDYTLVVAESTQANMLNPVGDVVGVTAYNTAGYVFGEEAVAKTLEPNYGKVISDEGRVMLAPTEEERQEVIEEIQAEQSGLTNTLNMMADAGQLAKDDAGVYTETALENLVLKAPASLASTPGDIIDAGNALFSWATNGWGYEGSLGDATRQFVNTQIIDPAVDATGYERLEITSKEQAMVAGMYSEIPGLALSAVTFNPLKGNTIITKAAGFVLETGGIALDVINIPVTGEYEAEQFAQTHAVATSTDAIDQLYTQEFAGIAGPAPTEISNMDYLPEEKTAPAATAEPPAPTQAAPQNQSGGEAPKNPPTSLKNEFNMKSWASYIPGLASVIGFFAAGGGLIRRTLVAAGLGLATSVAIGLFNKSDDKTTLRTDAEPPAPEAQKPDPNLAYNPPAQPLPMLMGPN